MKIISLISNFILRGIVRDMDIKLGVTMSLADLSGSILRQADLMRALSRAPYAKSQVGNDLALTKHPARDGNDRGSINQETAPI